MNFCMPRLATAKHDAFKQEEEWRLILSKYGVGTPAQVKVRTSPQLTPYVELGFDQSCIAEIVIGPGGDSHSERAVRAALRANNYNRTKCRSHTLEPRFAANRYAVPLRQLLCERDASGNPRGRGPLADPRTGAGCGRGRTLT